VTRIQHSVVSSQQIEISNVTCEQSHFSNVCGSSKALATDYWMLVAVRLLAVRHELFQRDFTSGRFS
jgi:hypothetical protein